MKIKELSRTTPCVLFEIRSPQWNGNRKCVGLNKARIGACNEIRFSYRRKSDGELSLPDHYYISGSEIKAANYPEMQIKGANLVMIPVSELSLLIRV